MPRMSPETQRELGWTDEQVDFDEFLQETEHTPRGKELMKKMGPRLKRGHAAVEGLKRAKSK